MWKLARLALKPGEAPEWDTRYQDAGRDYEPTAQTRKFFKDTTLIDRNGFFVTYEEFSDGKHIQFWFYYKKEE